MAGYSPTEVSLASLATNHPTSLRAPFPRLDRIYRIYTCGVYLFLTSTAGKRHSNNLAFANESRSFKLLIVPIVVVVPVSC